MGLWSDTLVSESPVSNSNDPLTQHAAQRCVSGVTATNTCNNEFQTEVANKLPI